MNKFLFFFITTFLVLSCESGNQDSLDELEGDTIIATKMNFDCLPKEQTTIDFTNTIVETKEFNFFSYEYIYNGSGVATGDINNDGLIDIFFSGNQVEDKLYLNKGNMKFEDISASAFKYDLTEGWHTGVNMVDLNGDGWLDIYICRSGDPKDKQLLSNLLFINNQDNTFTERSQEFGLDVQSRSTHSIFFDYDNDNDLDLYILNHPRNKPDDPLLTKENFKKEKLSGEGSDIFLENREGKFVDVTAEVGIIGNYYGLGVAAADFDGNGYTDIYVSNDYQDVDVLYMNYGGKFKEEIKSKTNHISSFSMGSDVADVNNDGLLDIFTADMASEDHIRSKRNMGAMSTKNFWETVDLGLHHQYMFNCLQLNNGNGTFSDVAQLAGISKTDWSWAPLFIDFNNDGHKDLFVTNGYRKEVRDNDFLNSYNQQVKEKKQITFQEGLDLMPSTKIQNYVYQNMGDLRFEKRVEEWNVDFPVNTNGAAFADLDNDGDLDMVLNNMEENSFILENKLESQNNYVRLKINGPQLNSQSIGAKVYIFTKEGSKFHEIQNSRGYESSMENIVHFGLGSDHSIDSVIVQWPDGKILKSTKLKTNSLNTISYNEAKASTMNLRTKKSIFFQHISDSLFSFTHEEKHINDFETEVLLPHKMSQLGPFISVGDVNNDNLEDFYISGAKNFTGKLFVQSQNGSFMEQSGPWKIEKAREELGSIFIDVDGDGDQDLYIVSGGNEYEYNSPFMQDQLYINDGKGNFKNETSARLPKMEASGQRIAASDFDSDGDVDLFIGGRQMPVLYPYTSRSFLLENDGDGTFTDVSIDIKGSANGTHNAFEAPGMVTDMLFDDFDGDGDDDLIVVGEWMPITFYENRDKKFFDVTTQYNKKMDIGWWYSITKGDFNGDGKMDYVVGNVGENNKFHPSKDKPLELYVDDFDENGTYDIVLAKYQKGICYPVRGRQCSSEQMPYIKQKFPTYNDYATADVSKIYGHENLEKALHYSATNFSSVILLSDNGGYTQKRLPVYAQFAPLNKSIVRDIDKDGNLDILGVGNNFAAEIETIRYDAGVGFLFLGDGKGNFEHVPNTVSGFFENNDCKDMAIIESGKNKLIITVSNRNKAKTFLIK